MVRRGWAGRLADNIVGFNTGSMFPPITSVAGSAIFCTGQQTQPYAMIPGTTPRLRGFDSSASAAARLQALQQLLTFDTGVSLIQAASSITSNFLADSKIVSAALASATPLSTTFPNTSLGSQLKQIAQLPSVRSALSLNRQVFKPNRYAASVVLTVKCSDECLLQFRSLVEPRAECNDFHHVRLQPYVPARL